MWGMYSGVKANDKHDGDNETFIGSSGDPLLAPYTPLISGNFYFCIWLLICPLNFAAANYQVKPGILLVLDILL